MKTTVEMGLTAPQLDQQLDLSRRLLRMAMLGVPRTSNPAPADAELLAVHALLTAVLALAEATPAITTSVAHVAFEASHKLTEAAELRLAQQSTTNH